MTNQEDNGRYSIVKTRLVFIVACLYKNKCRVFAKSHCDLDLKVQSIESFFGFNSFFFKNYFNEQGNLL